MPTMGEMIEAYEQEEQEQQKDDLTEFERICDEIYALQSRLELLKRERKKLGRQLGFAEGDED